MRGGFGQWEGAVGMEQSNYELAAIGLGVLF